MSLFLHVGRETLQGKTETLPGNLCIQTDISACLSGKVYAVGGHDGNEHLGSMEVFDPLTNKWMMKASMNTKRYVSQDPHGTKFKSYSTIHHFLLMLKNCVSVLPLFGFPNFCFVLFFSYFVAWILTNNICRAVSFAPPSVSLFCFSFWWAGFWSRENSSTAALLMFW